MEYEHSDIGIILYPEIIEVNLIMKAVRTRLIVFETTEKYLPKHEAVFLNGLLEVYAHNLSPLECDYPGLEIIVNTLAETKDKFKDTELALINDILVSAGTELEVGQIKLAQPENFS